MCIVSGWAGIQTLHLDFKTYVAAHFTVCCCGLMTALQIWENHFLISVTCKLSTLRTLKLRLWVLSPPGRPPLFVNVPLQVRHLGQITELSVWSDKPSETPSMKALTLHLTLEVERNKSLSSCYLPPDVFPMGPLHFSSKEDMTCIFLHKLRAFFFFFVRPF